MEEHQIPANDDFLRAITGFVAGHIAEAKNAQGGMDNNSDRSKRQETTEDVLPNHSYAVLEVTGDTPETQVLKIWNPWGKGVPERVSIEDRLGNGIFRMKYADFIGVFNALHMASPFVPRSARIEGCWSQKEGTNGGFYNE